MKSQRIVVLAACIALCLTAQLRVSAQQLALPPDLPPAQAPAETPDCQACRACEICDKPDTFGEGTAKLGVQICVEDVGVPFLSSIPYVNKLFKNTGVAFVPAERVDFTALPEAPQDVVVAHCVSEGKGAADGVQDPWNQQAAACHEHPAGTCRWFAAPTGVDWSSPPVGGAWIINNANDKCATGHCSPGTPFVTGAWVVDRPAETATYECEQIATKPCTESPETHAVECTRDEHIHELIAENARLSAMIEAQHEIKSQREELISLIIKSREEALEQRANMIEKVAEAQIANAKLQAELSAKERSYEMMSQVVEVMVQKAKLEAQLEATQQQHALVMQLAEMRAAKAHPAQHGHAHGQGHALKEAHAHIVKLQQELAELRGSVPNPRYARPLPPEPPKAIR